MRTDVIHFPLYSVCECRQILAPIDFEPSLSADYPARSVPRRLPLLRSRDRRTAAEAPSSELPDKLHGAPSGEIPDKLHGTPP